MPDYFIKNRKTRETATVFILYRTGFRVAREELVLMVLRHPAKPDSKGYSKRKPYS